jgi:hypothetical protein
LVGASLVLQVRDLSRALRTTKGRDDDLHIVRTLPRRRNRVDQAALDQCGGDLGIAGFRHQTHYSGGSEVGQERGGLWREADEPPWRPARYELAMSAADPPIRDDTHGSAHKISAALDPPGLTRAGRTQLRRFS